MLSYCLEWKPADPDRCECKLKLDRYGSMPMMKKLLVICIILVSVLQFSSVFGEVTEVQINTIWNAPISFSTDGGMNLDFDQASKVIQWQRTGFLAGLRDAPGNIAIEEVMISEQDNLSRSTADLADLFNTENVIMTIGASSEVNTMYAAMVTDFFSIPILVPFSDGELYVENDRGTTFRLTPTGQKYADYIGNELLSADLSQRINTLLFENKPIPEYSVNVAVFFSDDYSDNETAVKITQKLMDNGIDMCYYKPFETGHMLEAVRSAWENDKSQVQEADVVIFLPQDKDSIVELASIVNMWGDQDIPPAFILIGYVPEYTDTVTFNMDNVYVLRQATDRSQCPQEVIHHEGAMGYAAGYITKLALSRAVANTGPEKKGWRLWLKTPDQKRQIHENYLESLRTATVTALRQMTDYIPCFGEVSFMTSDDMSDLKLIRYLRVDQSAPVDNSEVFLRIVNRIRSRYGITGW